jgi:D-glycero-D-manno-heptose 1,7-bisphosphate phosphatase
VKLLIVDRDGVISRDADGRTARPGDWQSLPGAAEAIARLNHGGYRVAVMVDRGPLTRGACDMSALNGLHARMVEEVESHGGQIDLVLYVPPPGAPDRCDAAAATLGDVLARLGGTPAATVLVTDSQCDLDAAHAAGCRPVLVLSGHGRATFERGTLPAGTVVRVDLAAVAAELAP